MDTVNYYLVFTTHPYLRGYAGLPSLRTRKRGEERTTCWFCFRIDSAETDAEFFHRANHYAILSHGATLLSCRARNWLADKIVKEQRKSHIPEELQ
jgi:hypothetical protein